MLLFFCGTGVGVVVVVSQSFSSERENKRERDERRIEKEGRKERRKGREGAWKGEKSVKQETKAGAESIHSSRNPSIEQESATLQIIKLDPPLGGHLRSGI